MPNSKRPITILMAVPLTLPFALISLMLLRTPLDVYAMIGLFMLFGIVKKNGILQVDYTNVLLAKGLPLNEAILRANEARFRPILMTTVMLVAAMIPIATGRGPGAGARASMAKVILGGQLLSLLPKDSFEGNTLIARFRHDLDTRKLQIKPLSIVTQTSIVRLTM